MSCVNVYINIYIKPIHLFIQNLYLEDFEGLEETKII